MSTQPEGASPRHEVTRILEAARDGAAGALDDLGPLIYDELRGVARRQLRRIRPGETLDTTALVHEAYLKLVDQDRAQWQDHAHFVAVAAVTMRHLLVDYARSRSAQKRGGDMIHVSLGDRQVGKGDKAIEVLAVDEALETLTRRSERLGRLVELRFFGGLSVKETAEVMGTSERTVKRDWRKARAVLFSLLEESGAA